MMSLRRFPELLKLSESERIQLAQDLWDSIPVQSEALCFDEGQLREMERRLAEHQIAPETSISWESARAALRDRFGA